MVSAESDDRMSIIAHRADAMYRAPGRVGVRWVEHLPNVVDVVARRAAVHWVYAMQLIKTGPTPGARIVAPLHGSTSGSTLPGARL